MNDNAVDTDISPGASDLQSGELADLLRLKRSILDYVELEKAVVEISSSFARLKPEKVDSAINLALDRLGNLAGAERLNIFTFQDEGKFLDNTHGWCCDNIESQIDKIQRIPSDRLSWWIDRLHSFEPMNITDTSELPREALDEMETLSAGDVKSLIMLPMVQYGSLIGFLGVYTTREKHRWSEDTCIVLKLASETISNVLDRRKTEEALSESRKVFRSVFNSIDEILMFLDSEFTIQNVNLACSKIMNIPLEEFKGRKCYSLLYHRDEVCEDCPAQEAVKVENPASRLKYRPDGMILNETVYPELDHNGRLSGAIVIATDITESKYNERKMNERREFLEALLASAPDAIVTLNPEQRILDWNPGAEKLFAYTADEAVGRNIDDLVTGADVEEEARGFTSTILKGEEISPVETIRYRKDGTLVDVLVSGSPIMLDGELVAVLAIYTDITEKKRAREELARRTRLESLGTLAGGLAHDFNNMLSGIFGNVSLAKDNLSKDSEAYSYIEAVDKAMERATGLTQQLLTFASGSEPVVESVDPGKTLLESLEFNLAGSSIKHHLAIEENIWRVGADRRQLAQVISNLIINAKQAMPSGGSLYIEAANYQNSDRTVRGLDPGNFVRISIRDEGNGIPEENFEKIFDPYFSTKKTGSGLGLAVVHSIVQKHGGMIGVESAPGEGACFTVYLTAAEKSCIAEKEDSVSDEPSEVSTEVRVLIMDDEIMIRKVLKSMLERLGCSVDQTVDGDQAVSMYKDSIVSGAKYNLIVMDLTIPGGKGGKEAVLDILEIDPEASVIVSSGYSTDPVMADYESYGFTDVLVKPYKIEDLQEVIYRVLKN
ncbi:MAG: PAS domain S-box protein [Candidatus Aegiribacteria sp.]|nr:PAS domain S-box protein [Candidatus Aegiribacteria sp.]